MKKYLAYRDTSGNIRQIEATDVPLLKMLNQNPITLVTLLKEHDMPLPSSPVLVLIQ